MSLHLLAYRTFSFLRHQLTAWNTGGEGIHSPYLFYFVRHCLYDSKPFYAFQPIEQLRNALLNNNKSLHITDYGTGKHTSPNRTVKHIAATSLESPKNAQLLFRLVHFLSDRQWNGNRQSPLHILELGTSLGITTAYLAAPSSRNQVTTLEGSQELLQLAQSNWNKLKINNIQPVCGNIHNTLSPALNQLQYLDLAFIDANHTAEATLRYFNTILPFVSAKSVIVLDDIHWNPDMERAWHTIKTDPRVTSTFDLYNLGMVFFDPAYLRRHYKLRF